MTSAAALAAAASAASSRRASFASRSARACASRAKRFSSSSASWRRNNSACCCASSSRRPNSASSITGASSTSGAPGASSRLMKVRFLRTSTWIVRALPLESACLISLVDLRMTVIFLRSVPGVVPCDTRRKSSSRSLSESVNASSVDALLTPADCSCSSSAAAGRFSSAANWATVVTAIGKSLNYGVLQKILFV